MGTGGQPQLQVGLKTLTVSLYFITVPYEYQTFLRSLAAGQKLHSGGADGIERRE